MFGLRIIHVAPSPPQENLQEEPFARALRCGLHYAGEAEGHRALSWNPDFFRLHNTRVDYTVGTKIVSRPGLTT